MWSPKRKLKSVNSQPSQLKEESKVPGKKSINMDGGGGGGGTAYNGLYGEALPERGTVWGLLVYERVQILLIEVYERIGRSVIWVCERAQRAEQMNSIAL